MAGIDSGTAGTSRRSLRRAAVALKGPLHCAELVAAFVRARAHECDVFIAAGVLACSRLGRATQQRVSVAAVRRRAQRRGRCFRRRMR